MLCLKAINLLTMTTGCNLVVSVKNTKLVNAAFQYDFWPGPAPGQRDWGAEINFGGAREVCLCEFERGTGGTIYSSVDQTNKVKITNSKILAIVLAIFHEFLSLDQKKRSSSQNFYEIRCESTKITKIRADNTNLRVLGLNLHFNSPEPVNFFGAQSSLGGGHNFRLGGHKQSVGVARPRNAPPWRRACFWHVIQTICDIFVSL